MAPAGPGRWTGSLSDAEGPVEIATTGDALHLSYRTPGGARIEQRLAAQGPRRVRNAMTIRKWGVVVARLDETIVAD